MLTKKCLAVLMAVVMLLAVAACSVNTDDTPATAPPSTSNTSTAQPAGDADPQPADPQVETPVSTGYTVDESQIKGREIFLYHQSEGVRSKQYQEEFAAMYGCTFRELIIPYEQYAAKLVSLIMSGDSPDVFDLNDEVLPMYALRKIADPIDGFFDPDSPYLDHDIMNGMQYKGQTYILHPNGRVPVMVFYNKSMFDRYGVDTPMEYYERGEWNIDTMYEIASEFNEDTDNDGVVDQFGFVGTSVYEFLGANQLPLAEYDTNASKFTLSLGNQKQLDVLQDALDHIISGDIQPFGWTAANLFPQGKLAMAGYEEWFAYSLGAMEDDWSVAPYPVGKYGDKNRKYVRPWGAGVAAGAANGYAGMQYAAYTFAQDELYAAQSETAPWTGERGTARKIATNEKTSYFSMHIGIPGFRSVVDTINYGMTAEGGKPVSALFDEQKTVLEQIIGDFNNMQEGWVAPREFINPGPINFEDGMGYLTLQVDPAVHQSIADEGIDGKSLHITLDQSGWYQVFGSSPDALDFVGGGKAYDISFDYRIITAGEDDPMFYTLYYPGEGGWTEVHVTEGEEGHFAMTMAVSDDAEGMYFTVCFFGGTDIMIDNFNISLVE